MKKVMLVFGTRPEAIKMCPLVNELKSRKNIETVVCVSGQHREMLDQVLNVFGVVPDYDLSIMKDKQTLFDITTNILNRIKEVLEKHLVVIFTVFGLVIMVNRVVIHCLIDTISRGEFVKVGVPVAPEITALGTHKGHLVGKALFIQLFAGKLCNNCPVGGTVTHRFKVAAVVGLVVIGKIGNVTEVASVELLKGCHCGINEGMGIVGSRLSGVGGRLGEPGLDPGFVLPGEV